MSNNDRWGFAKEPEPLIHRIHNYPARFPAFIVTEALSYAEEKGVKVKTMADVFCGCGTTAVEAKRHNKDFWGWDVNPVATLITRTKCGYYNDEKLEEHFENIRKEFSRTSVKKKDIEGVHDRIKYWFDGERIRDLLKLKYAIYEVINKASPYRKFFLCAYSNILKPTSQWLTKSIKPQIDPGKCPSDVMCSFESQFNQMRKANKSNTWDNRYKPVTWVHKGNFLLARPKIPFVDLIITSPPYVISYDYADLHQLSLLWLDFTKDYRKLRKYMIGNRYGVNPVAESAVSNLPRAAEEICNRLMEKDQHRANAVAKYFLDIEKSILRCWSILRQNGMVVFVIGNTAYRGVEIDNAGYLASCMKIAGFKSVKKISRRMSLKTLTPYRDIKGRFAKQAGQKEVYAKEFIVVGRKI